MDERNEKSEVLMYQSDDGITKIQVQLNDNTVWLTQADMVDLLQSSKPNISEHIKHIFEEGELAENSVVRKFRTTAADALNSPSSKICLICSLILALLD